MSASDQSLPTRIDAKNTGPGAQYLKDGDGDQNVASDNGAVYKIGHLSMLNVSPGGLRGLGISTSLSHLSPSMTGDKMWFQEPTCEDVLHWLNSDLGQAPYDFDSHRRRLLSQVTPGTGKWILTTEQYLAWKDGTEPSRFLWMHGNVGSGKTMLVSIIVDSIRKELQNRSDAACLDFYFTEGEDNHVFLARIWATLLAQLLRVTNTPMAILRERCRSALHGSAPPHFSEYLDLITAQAASLKTVYLIIDALDFCQNVPEEDTRHKLGKALRGFPDSFRILFTSRNDNSIGTELGVKRGYAIAPTEQDLEVYVTERISNDGVLQSVLEGRARDREEVVKKVSRMAHSRKMFLLARLHMDSLAGKYGTVAAVRDALGKLHESVSDIFEASAQHIARSIQRGNFEGLLVRHVLTWVMNAKKALNENEIRESYAAHQSRLKGGPWQHHQPHPRLILQALQACIGLIVLDPEKRTLGLIHESARKPLRDCNVVPENHNLEMGKTCLVYLLGDHTTDGEHEPPLLRYAARNWWYHLCDGGQRDLEAESMTMRFLRDGAKLARAFEAMGRTERGLFNGITGLHAAAHFDLPVHLAECLVDSGIDINAQCSDGQTAMHWAVRYGRPSLVELLVKKKAELDLPDRFRDTPLHKALTGPTPDDAPLHQAVVRSTADNLRVVKSLVRGKARLDLPNNKGCSSLLWAIRYGPTSIARVMIEDLDDINAELSQNWPVLRVIFSHGHEMTYHLSDGAEGSSELRAAVMDHAHILTDLMLERGVELNQPTGDGWTPLIHAARTGDLSKLARILARKFKPADIGVADRDGKPPLWHAVFHKQPAATKMLIDCGAYVHERYNDGLTPLLLAVKQGDRETVWVLLNAGARPDDRDDSGRSGLLYAVEKRYNDIAWLLLAQSPKHLSPSLNKNGHQLQEALEMALDHDDCSMAWLLCEHGASAALLMTDRKTLLHRAAKRKNHATLRFLVDRGGALAAKDSEGMTPIHHVVRSFGDESAELLDHLASRSALRPCLNIANSDGYTALTFATVLKKPSAMEILIRHGASCDEGDRCQMTALHHAARMDFGKGMRLLLKAGSNPNALDKERFTPLHHLVSGRSNNPILVNDLMNAKAVLEPRDTTGRTPLMLAIQLKKLDLARALLDAGASTRTQDSEGWDAFDYADEVNFLEGRALLKKYGGGW
ncbi:ankyrin repeat-containing domain protein [Chaetomium strumarium]|uniref:Ankyrin repeat-containing domain protein n=1 Tax=Chaetomium strumarium TaxID=1170767 RepID=A0AAJ0GN01_9PEZI|nr:ankyrin repeat-containing domain protein [Chaetomium strumarium]